MPAARPPRLRLFDILDAIAGIERLQADLASENRTAKDAEYRALERYVEIISEASRGIPGELKASESDIPWRAIADIGNILRHGYDRIDKATIDDIVQFDLPALKDAASRLYAACKAPSDPWP